MKQLVLLGSGPNHLRVLKQLAQAPLPGAQVTLVASAERELLAGLLPAWVAGRLSFEACSAPLAPLVEAARASWVPSSVLTLDAAQRSVQLTDGQTLHYDVLSLDTAPSPLRDTIPGASENALWVQAGEPFLQGWQSLCEQAQRGTLSVAVVGADVAAVELAFAVQSRLAARVRVALVTGGGTVLASHAGALRARVINRLKRRKIVIFENGCAAIGPRQLQLDQGPRLVCDAALMVPPPVGPAPFWASGSGLALDAQGALQRRPSLQSASHAEVFVAGEALAANLRRFLAGAEPVASRSRQPWGRWVACDGQLGVVSLGPLAIEAHWVGARKERREREALGGLLAS